MSDRIVVMREGRIRGDLRPRRRRSRAVMATASHEDVCRSQRWRTDRSSSPIGRLEAGVSGRRRLRPERIKELTLLLLIVVTLVGVQPPRRQLPVGRFFNRVTQGVAVTAVMAAGQSLVIITRNIDLSVGSIAGVSAYLTGDVLGDHSATPPVVAVAPRRRHRHAARSRQRGARRLRADPVDHRHARHAGDLPDVADQLRRSPHDHGRARCRSGSSTCRARRCSPSASSSSARCSSSRSSSSSSSRCCSPAARRAHRSTPSAPTPRRRCRPGCQCAARRWPRSPPAGRSPDSAGSSCSPASARSR